MVFRASTGIASIFGALVCLPVLVGTSGSESPGAERIADPLALAAVAHPDGQESQSPWLPLEVARIYFEFNSTDDDLGVHVLLDGEDWKKMRIEDPMHRLLFEVQGHRGYATLGMTELFFEGAEPSLSEVPLCELLAKFPEGQYRFRGRSVDNEQMAALANLSHGIPAGPTVSSLVGAGNLVSISWSAVTTNPPGFPVRPITITGYQVIVESFHVTLPGSATSVMLPPEFVASLGSGQHEFEVLAIDQSGNQTITSDTFVLP